MEWVDFGMIPPCSIKSFLNVCVCFSISSSTSRQDWKEKIRIRADFHVTNWEAVSGESVVVTQPLEGNNQPMPLSVRTGINGIMSWSSSQLTAGLSLLSCASLSCARIGRTNVSFKKNCRELTNQVLSGLVIFFRWPNMSVKSLQKQVPQQIDSLFWPARKVGNEGMKLYMVIMGIHSLIPYESGQAVF